jgi:ArsR family transcriptional regulator
MNTHEEFELCAARLSAVADPTRLRIMVLLFDGPEFVGYIADFLGDDLTRISHHLGVLRKANIVTTTKRGRFVEYGLHPDVYLSSYDGTGERCFVLGGCRLLLPPVT